MTSEPRQWRKVVLGVEPLAADAAAGWLFEGLGIGLSTEMRGGAAEISLFFDAAEPAAEALASELRGYLSEIEAPDVVHIVHDGWIVEENWAEIWRKHAQPIAVGERLLILPSGHEDSEPGRLVIHLDPGLAFGTGSHVSTRIALQMLESTVRPGDTVADVGCGSGILSLACALLGAGAVHAIDVDPQAIEATEANAARNGVTSLIHAREGRGIPEPPREGFDAIVANISPIVIAGLLPEVPGALRPGGVFLASGILDERLREVLEPLADQTGLEVLEVLEQEGWCGVACRRTDR